MPRTYGILSVWLFLIAAMPVKSQVDQCIARVDGQGSLPPLPQLYECVRDLNGKPYDTEQAKSCLDSILASGYVKTGRVDVAKGNSKAIVRFVLVDPPLIVKDLDFDVEGSLKAPMLAWIQATGDILKVGDEYRENHDLKTREVIGFYFRHLGKQVGISRKIELDYHVNSAKVIYRITVGANIPPTRALPPYETACPQRIATFNLTGVDDSVPLNIVEKLTKTHAFGCFSADEVTNDTLKLRNSGLFNDVRYDVRTESSKDDKEVDLHLIGKPLKVREVRIVGHGLLSGRSFPEDPTLGIQSNDQYRRSAADAARNYLTQKYAASHQVIDVTEDDELLPNHEVIVTFDVVAYGQDQLTINGAEFYVAPAIKTYASGS